MAKQEQGAADGATETDTDAALQDGVGAFFDKTIGGKGGAPKAKEAADTDAEDDEADANDEDPADEDDDSGDEEGDDDSDEEDGDADGDADDDDGEEDGEDGEDDEVDAEDDEDALDPSFEAAAAKHRLPTRFEDVVRTLPKEQQAKTREAFRTRLKEVEGGFTRAMQEQRAGRKSLATLTAEKEWIEKNPIDYMLDLYTKDPKIFDKLNAELEKFETPLYAEAKTMQRDSSKKEIERRAKEEEDKAEQAEKDATRRAQRGEHVSALAKRLAKTEGVPYHIVEKALYIAITTSPEGDLSDVQIRKIVAGEAKELRRHTGERKREDRKTYVRDKVAESKAAKKRPTSRDRGHSPAPGRVKPPKSLEEALSRSAARIFPDAPAGT